MRQISPVDAVLSMLFDSFINLTYDQQVLNCCRVGKINTRCKKA
jgi:hypothetical protein